MFMSDNPFSSGKETRLDITSLQLLNYVIRPDTVTKLYSYLFGFRAPASRRGISHENCGRVVSPVARGYATRKARDEEVAELYLNQS